MSTNLSQPAGTVAQFDPYDPAILRDPYPTYAAFRAVDPVHWGLPSMHGLPGSWYCFAYDDNARVLGEPETFASDPKSVGMSAAGEEPKSYGTVSDIFSRWLGGMDPPEHRRLRSIMAKAFTPRRISEMKPRVQAITGELLRKALDRSDGKIDVIADLSFPLPMSVVGSALGVPSDDWILFQTWAKQIMPAIDRAGADPETDRLGAAAIQGMFDYLAARVAQVRKNPDDDLLGAMVTASDDDGEPMREFDIVAIAVELGIAGQETTSNSVAKSVLGLMEQRDRWAELANGSDAFWDRAAEELLRWTSPVQRQRWRWAKHDVVLRDKNVQPGQAVVSMLGAANRDPDKFPDPDLIRFDRSGERIMTFGFGPHYCLGHTLARMELRVALQALVNVIPDMTLVEDPAEIEWHNNFASGGPRTVWVTT